MKPFACGPPRVCASSVLRLACAGLTCALPPLVPPAVDVPELGYLSADQPCPRGELCVRSPSLFSGYYNDAAATAEVRARV